MVSVNPIPMTLQENSSLLSQENSPILLQDSNHPDLPTDVAKSNQYLNRKHLLIGVTGLAIISTLAIIYLKTSAYYENGKIDKFDCRFGETVEGIVYNADYYRKASEKFLSKATDQYCLAEILKNVEKNLPEARNWYKKASEQGLVFAQKALCQKSMFEINFSLGDLYYEFRSLCCLKSASYHRNGSCPWYDPNV